LIGGLAVAGLLLLVNLSQKRGLVVTWWQWLLTVLAFAYLVFTSEAIHAILLESSGQAALVLSLVLGLPAVIWFVLLGRFVFVRSGQTS
jgi:hypothetical protein